MNHSTPHGLSILVMHSDPLLTAGIAAALRQHVSFNTHVYDGGFSSTSETRVDVIIADYENAMRLTDPANRRGLGQITEAHILALTSNDREADIRRAIEAGVHGYLLVGTSLSELVDGVNTVGHGARYLCHSVARRMADSLTHAALTLRELEVLQLAASGQPNKVIARRLDIAVGTVKSHMSAIMSKLGACSRTQAANMATARGLVEDRSAAACVTPSH